MLSNSVVMMLSLFSGVLLLTVIQEASSQTPGAKLQVSQTGLEYAASVALDILDAKIKDQQIDDQSGTASVAGSVDYSIKNVKIQSFTRPKSTVIVNEGSGITWALANSGISATGGWGYKYKLLFIKISDSGTFDLTVTGASASVTITLGSDADGRPTISVLGCSCTIDKVNVKFHGGASWIYNLFSGFVEKPIKSALEKAVCEAATKTINNNAAHQLATLKTRITVEESFVIDYSLVEPPLFALGYIQSSHKGEVFYTGDFSEAPFSASPILTGTPDRMLTVFISYYVFNTFGYVLQQHDILSYVVTKDDVPENFQSFFSTDCPSGTCVGTLFPELASNYPNSFIEIDLKTTSSPTLAILVDLITVTFQGEINIGVQQSDEVSTLLSLRVTITCSLTAGIRGNYITGAVTKFSPSISVISSTMNDLPEDSLNQLLEVASNAFIVPKLNEVGEKGFAIPSLEHVVLVGPTLAFLEGVIVISTDVRYTS